MVQIMMRWDTENLEDLKLADHILRGFHKIGCWSSITPPEGSIYKTVIVYEGEDLKSKNKKP